MRENLIQFVERRPRLMMVARVSLKVLWELTKLAAYVVVGVGLGFALMLVVLFGWSWSVGFTGPSESVTDAWVRFGEMLVFGGGFLGLLVGLARLGHAGRQIGRAYPASQQERAAGIAVQALVADALGAEVVRLSLSLDGRIEIRLRRRAEGSLVAGQVWDHARIQLAMAVAQMRLEIPVRPAHIEGITTAAEQIVVKDIVTTPPARGGAPRDQPVSVEILLAETTTAVDEVLADLSEDVAEEVGRELLLSGVMRGERFAQLVHGLRHGRIGTAVTEVSV